MGFVGFLKFAFKCFDLLAWPLFGLGCPLYASIRAIENNSNTEMRNLVAYWILFSLVSLFELAFVKLIQWLPFWSYMKLMAMCLLVLPDFNGASYVYECLLRPCLFVDPRVVTKYFIRPKEDKSLNAENFLAMAERYVQENGSEALEKLLDLKSKHTKPDIGVEEIKAMTNMEEKETAAAIQSKHTKTDVGMEEKKAMTNTGEKETDVPIQSKYEELIFGEVDARAVEQPEKTPLAATKLARFSIPFFQSKHTKPDIGMEEIKAMTNPKEKETPVAIQSKYEELIFGEVDARAVEQPEKTPLAATKLARFSIPLFQSKHTKPDIGMEGMKAMTNPEEKETPVAIQSKYKELIFGEVDARAAEQPEKTPLAATKLERFSIPLFQSKHTKPDIGMEEIKAMTNPEEKETPVAIQSKYEELIFGEVDARAVEQPEKTPVAATKLSQVKEPIVGMEDTNTGQLKDKNPALATEQVKCVELNLAQNEKKTVDGGEIKEKTVGAAGGENKAVEITGLEKVQREWTCALCQVTTTCEKDLHSHLKGRRHMDNCQELRASMQMNKTRGSSSSAASPEPKKTLNVDRPFDNKVQVNRTNGKCREKFSCSICDVKLLSETDWASHLRGNRHLSNTQDYIACGMNPFKFSCSICDVKLISEIDLAAHLRGIRHLTNTQQRNDNLGGWYY